MATIENAVGKFGSLWQLDKTIQVEKLSPTIRECAARAMNEPRFLANAVIAVNPTAAISNHAGAPQTYRSSPETTQLKTPILIVGALCTIAVVICAWMADYRHVSAIALEAPNTGSLSPKPISYAAESAAQTTPASASAGERALAAAAISQWAAAWSARDIERYLGFYAKDFIPPDNIARDAWQEKRRDRILGKQHILVTIDDLGVEMLGHNRAIARFAQTYEADRYREVRAPKTLILTREAGEWRIADEINLRAGSPPKR